MPSTPEQLLKRRRAELVIGLVSPALELVLRVGERVSRVVGGEDTTPSPIRPAAEARELGALRSLEGERAPDPGEEALG